MTYNPQTNTPPNPPEPVKGNQPGDQAGRKPNQQGDLPHQGPRQSDQGAKTS